MRTCSEAGTGEGCSGCLLLALSESFCCLGLVGRWTLYWICGILVFVLNVTHTL